jgi:PPM family protein phosphatase
MTESVSDSASETPVPPGIWVRVYGLTDVGQVREHNEDSFFVADLSTGIKAFPEAGARQLGTSGAVFGVCDGMGGAAAGEVASKLAVEIIYNRLIDPSPPVERDELARRLVGSIQDAGVRIYSDARADRAHRGMGTTATIATLLDARLFVAQVGDSRAYILRDQELVQITRDQSLVNQLIEAGQLTEEEAETFEHNNIILQALGTAEAVQVDLTCVDLRREDTLVLCSDGLSGMVRAEEICGLLSEADTPAEACRRLIEAANAAGGHDNVTVVVVRFEGAGLLPHAADDAKVGYTPVALPAYSELPPRGRDASLRTTAKEAPLSRARAREIETVPSPPPGPEVADAEESLVVPISGLTPRTVGALVAAVTLIIAMALLFLR